MKRPTRRDVLAFGLGAGALLPGLGGCSLAEGDKAEAASPAEPGLTDRALRKGILFGAAAEAAHLDKDPQHAEAFLRECKLLVSQNELKWGVIRPAPGVFDFRRPDRLASFAAAHRLAFRGHTLVWHISNPAWLAPALAGGRAEKLLTEHIWSVAGRYRGAMQSWDVVNEAIEISDGRTDGMRKTLWLNALGPGYIETAFRIAHAADPAAKLVYNDYGLDYADDDSARKREAVLGLLARLVHAKAPVHALGIQAHLRAGRKFDPHVMRRFLDATASLGLDLYITELDVEDIDLPRRETRRDALVAKATAAYLDTVLAHPAVKLVATWGLSDRYSFRNEPEFRHWSWSSRPLPLDDRMNRKAMWRAMAQAFDAAPIRPPSGT
jgi:endo-1,4-beta-xylanase